MKLKRLTAFLMTAALVLSLTACGGSGQSSDSGSSAESETEAGGGTEDTDRKSVV